MAQSSLLLISYSAVFFSMTRPLCQQPPGHHQPGFPGWSEADCCPYLYKVSVPASKAVRHLCRAWTSSPTPGCKGQLCHVLAMRVLYLPKSSPALLSKKENSNGCQRACLLLGRPGQGAHTDSWSLSCRCLSLSLPWDFCTLRWGIASFVLNLLRGSILGKQAFSCSVGKPKT